MKNGLQGLVSKLRRALGSTDLVAMRSGGYVLEIEPEAVDVHRFERLVAQGRAASDPDETVALLTEAERLWRGDALGEFAYEDFASLPAARLHELRLAAMEERLDTELERGRHQAAVVELESAVAAHPLRERLRGLLMVALYRAGRQADALRVFQEGRTILGEELGLEPGPELRRLEAAVLAHDPALSAPADVPAPRSSRRSTISEPLTPLIGRTEELTALRRAAGPAPLGDPRRTRWRGEDPSGARGRAASGRRPWPTVGVWSSWRRSVSPPASGPRSRRPSTCPTRGVCSRCWPTGSSSCCSTTAST